MAQNPFLPDFSYSGYHYFDKPVPDIQGDVFDVTAYGAVPNDGLSDQAAIVRAITAAEQNNGGIVFFPPGRISGEHQRRQQPAHLHPQQQYHPQRKR